MGWTALIVGYSRNLGAFAKAASGSLGLEWGHQRQLWN